ncbi:hypothetical protein [Alloyangia pacifica]|uniref:Transporter n=1 Tax=Alloyangia pacifica TaxID=311180 RepID=A0A1I6RUE7_9RHOB|nr:hypothetical protein [Alloyangia pacifica]SDG61167.1 hypothetical protein SAMN04488245_103382 [Alloyangia pacifica]SFS68256.1 hypothetical protein SAMN04488050_103426 [Alloyangia pacifica]
MTPEDIQPPGIRAKACTISMTAIALTAALVCTAPQAHAQDGGYLDQVQREFEEINNGTNPTLLTTQAGIQYQFSQITDDLDAGLWEAFYTQPFGDGSKAFRFTLPYTNSPLDSAYDFGDFSVTYIDVFHLTEKTGAAFTAEFFLDTASREDTGYGQYAMETSLFYAWFLDSGAIFAPAWVQTFGLEGGNDAGAELNTTTVDFYYVPKLPNPKYYLTFDPAVIHDWEADRTFGSLQVTAGMLTGRAFGGDSQIFIKPGVLFGADAPADWSVQVGFKVLNF